MANTIHLNRQAKNRIFLIVLIGLLLLCSVIIAVWKANRTETASADYANRLFDASYVHQIDITLNAADWQDLNTNALDKKKYAADVMIDGEYFKNISISAKGSQTLRRAAKNEEIDRYSLKIKFDKFDSEQTYYGLDALNINNNISDASMMKDYIVYALFRKMDVPAPLASYSRVTVNGEIYGIFAIVEEMDEGFLKRSFNGVGQLYKPEAGDLTEINKNDLEAIRKMQNYGEDFKEHDVPLFLQSLNVYSKGADLYYTGDEPENYTDIFENSVTDFDENDEKNLISALKKLKIGNIKESLNVDEVLRYFAVHNFTSNYDSYTGKLVHNYYLYENSGKLSMFPWDYNHRDALCLNEDADPSDHLTVNHEEVDIDAPLTVAENTRPMWNWIPHNTEYLNTYHTYIDQLITNCLESGWALNEINRVNAMIREAVAEDPTSVYTIEEYDMAVEKLQHFIEQRTFNVREQLNKK